MEPRDTETYRPEGGPRGGSGLAAGDVLGRFVVLEKVGEGGMGEVYAARDPTLDRKVAIKVLRAEGYGSEHRRARLRREAQALAKVIHPNVVTIYEAGEHDGRVYLVMEFVEGETMQAWLRTPRAVAEVVARFRAAGEGLWAAHRAGLVHRDFKPENVLLGADGRVRVGDFGVVGLAGEDAAPSSDVSPAALTMSGTLIGTPRYMSPEHLGGGRVDARADQFAFAASLYLALYRQPPFEGATLAELRTNVVAGRLAAPPRGPGWLERIVRRGLATDAEQRYPSMQELLAALRRGPPVTGRRVAVAGGLALAAGIATLVAMRAQPDPCAGAASHLAGVWDPSLRAAAEQSFGASGRSYAGHAFGRAAAAFDAYAATWVDARTDACRATAVRHEQSAELLDARMACLDRRLDALGALTRLFANRADADVVDRAVPAALGLEPVTSCQGPDLMRAPKLTPEQLARRRKLDVVGAQIRAGKTKDAAPAAAAAVEEARAAGDKGTLGEALWLRARAQAEKDPRGAVATLEEASALAGDLRDDDLVARTLVLLFEVFNGMQNRRTDATALRPAVEAAVRKTGDERLRARFLAAVARLQIGEGKPSDALATVEEATALIEKLYGPDSLERSRAFRDRAFVLDRLGRNDESLAAGQKGLALAESILGPEHLEIYVYLSPIGNQYWRQRRFEEAEATYRRMLAISENTVGEDSLKTAAAVSNVGSVLLDRGKVEEALSYFQRAAATQEKILGPDNPALGSMVDNMGMALVRLERYDEALATFKRALVIREKTLPENHPDLATSLFNLGSFHAARGKPAEAIPWLTRSLAIDEASLPAGHPDTMHALAALAAAQAEAGRPADALALLKRAPAGGDPNTRAHLDYATAVALRASRSDPARARQLAEAARAVFAADPPDPEMLARVDRFLKVR